MNPVTSHHNRVKKRGSPDSGVAACPQAIISVYCNPLRTWLSSSARIL